jgi:hypothetical protein
MRKFTLLLLASLCISLTGFSNILVGNTATTITVNMPCDPVPDGTYSVDVLYFDLTIGDWFPGPNGTVYQTYTNVTVTHMPNQDVVYDFTNASPAANFPVGAGIGLEETEGKIRITGQGTGMNWDHHMLNCPSLPLTLLSFTAQLNSCKVDLRFVTADEYDMVSYVIERNGSCIYAFDAAVCSKTPFNDNQSHTYTCTDNFPIQGKNYYRLKMIGLSGYVKYSNIVMVDAFSCGPKTPPYKADCSGVDISGPSPFCSGTAEYVLTNVPSACMVNNTYTWSTDNANLGYIQSNSPSNTFTKYMNGHTTIMVTMSGCTEATKTRYRVVDVGTRIEGTFQSQWGQSYPLVNDGTGTNYVSSGWVSIHMTQPWDNLNWTFVGGSVNNWWASGNQLEFNISDGYSAMFQVDAMTSCGMGSELYTFIAEDFNYYRISPNPSVSETSVYIDEEILKQRKVVKSPDQSIHEVMVYDRLGKLMMHRKYNGGLRKVTLNTSNLKPDVYIARIFNGKKWMSVKFIKQ